MKYVGDLIIRTQADAQKWKNLTEITGDLYINSSAKLDALTTVGGDLYINAVKVPFPAYLYFIYLQELEKAKAAA